METITALLCIAGLCVAYGFAEVFLDKKTIEIIEEHDLFGVTEKEVRKIIHEYQTPLRAFAFIAITWIGWENGSNIFASGLITAALLWISIDLICNLWWLKQPAWYVGSTAATDKLISKPLVNWSLKFGILIAGVLIEIL